jgi:fructan beta-fructosidase
MKYSIPIFALIALVFTACKSENPPGHKALQQGYNEAHRPQFHFTPKANWMNDPNGLFYKDGNYHMFFQYYPDSTVWGPMHWGHAISQDLVRWKEQPIALYPDSLGYIFSGSAVVDHLNTSGFGNDSTPPVVAIFTYHDPIALEAGKKDFQSQGLAFSLDGGVTWTKYTGNPVLRNNTPNQDFRDPKVIWHPDSQQWVMALAVYDRVQFYGSENLKEWKFLSEFGIPGDTRLWECPDLFPIREAESREEKWVLLVSMQQQGPTGGTGTSYFVGDFDGTEFMADSAGQQWLDKGADNYAFVTFDNVPLPRHQRLGIGWMSNWQYAQQVPTSPWRSAMTVPRLLELHHKDGQYSLQATPVPALESLRDSGVDLPLTITNELDLSDQINPALGELDFQIDLRATTATTFGVTLGNSAGESVTLTVDITDKTLAIDRTQSGPKGFSEVFFDGPHTTSLELDGAVLDLRLLLDRASLELFSGNGALNITEVFFPQSPYTSLQLWAREGQLVLNSGKGFNLSSTWVALPDK